MACQLSTKKAPLVFDYSKNNSTLEHVQNKPYWEATLADSLAWSDHIHNVVYKANHTLGLLQCDFWSCKSNVNEISYRSLVHPQLEYASSVWDPFHQGEIHDKLKWRLSPWNKRHIQPLVQTKLANSARTCKHCSTKSSTYITFYTGHLLQTPAHNIRKNTVAFSNISTTRDCYKYSFISRTMVDWNLFLPHVRSAGSVDWFQKLLHDHQMLILN